MRQQAKRNEREEQHQRELRQAMQAATGDTGTPHLHGYLGGYCNNPDCDVRQVLIRVQGYYGNVEEIRCPSCRRLMLLGDQEHNVTATTSPTYCKQRDAEARSNVAMQIRRASGQHFFSGSELLECLSLTELGERFKFYREPLQHEAERPAENVR